MHEGTGTKNRQCPIWIPSPSSGAAMARRWPATPNTRERRRGSSYYAQLNFGSVHPSNPPPPEPVSNPRSLGTLKPEPGSAVVR